MIYFSIYYKYCDVINNSYKKCCSIIKAMDKTDAEAKFKQHWADTNYHVSVIHVEHYQKDIFVKHFIGIKYRREFDNEWSDKVVTVYANNEIEALDNATCSFLNDGIIVEVQYVSSSNPCE